METPMINYVRAKMLRSYVVFSSQTRLDYERRPGAFGVALRAALHAETAAFDRLLDIAYPMRLERV